jgi:hypothetical protein
MSFHVSCKPVTNPSISNPTQLKPNRARAEDKKRTRTGIFSIKRLEYKSGRIYIWTGQIHVLTGGGG